MGNAYVTSAFILYRFLPFFSYKVIHGYLLESM